jgi:hypothetical protein
MEVENEYIEIRPVSNGWTVTLWRSHQNDTRWERIRCLVCQDEQVMLELVRELTFGTHRHSGAVT